MKEGRRLGGVHAGPESKVLDGLSWEEARQMADAQVSTVTDGYMKVGAASKGIIQRDFQHNATVYKSPYAKNPFDAVSNEELEEYKRIINTKTQRDGGLSPTSPGLEDDTVGDTTDAGNVSRLCCTPTYLPPLTVSTELYLSSLSLNISLSCLTLTPTLTLTRLISGEATGDSTVRSPLSPVTDPEHEGEPASPS